MGVTGPDATGTEGTALDAAATDGPAAPAGVDPQPLPQPNQPETALPVLIVTADGVVGNQFRRLVERLDPEALVRLLRRPEDLKGALEDPPRILFLDTAMVGEHGGTVLPLLEAGARQAGIILLPTPKEGLLATVTELLRLRGLPCLGAARGLDDQQRIADWLAAGRAKIQGGPATAPTAPAAGAAPQGRPSLDPLTPDELRAGLESGALLLVYQPKITVPDGGLIGFEALARWRLPDGRIAGPGAFIPLAEREGLIRRVTRQVVEQAAAQLGDWLIDGYDVKVSVNISADDLDDPGFADFVRGAAESAGVPAERLVLEVTESRIATDIKQANQSLAALKAAGFEISIDDYGTGYSSLDQLQRMPADELKIDRAFVFEAWRVPARRVLLETSVAMGRKLGLRVVAEGAETLEDWRMLEATSADICQGYFVARPMPAGDIETWLERWRADKPAPTAPAAPMAEPAPAAPPPVPAKPPLLARPPVLAALLGVPLLLAALWFAVLGRAPEIVPDLVEVGQFTPRGDAPELLALADGLRRDTLLRLGEARVLGRLSGTDAEHLAEFAVDGEVERVDDKFRVQIGVRTLWNDVQVWSERIEHPANDAALLLDRVSSRVASMAACGIYFRSRQKDMTDEVMRLWFQVCAVRWHSQNNRAVTTITERIVAANPDHAMSLGFHSAVLSFWAALATGEEAAALKRRSDEYAQRALKLDPNDGFALFATARSKPIPDELAAYERYLVKSFSSGKAHTFPLSAYANHLRSVGRLEEAVEPMNRLIAIDPFFFSIRFSFAQLLGSLGRIEEAKEQSEVATRYQFERAVPNAIPVTLDFIYGDPATVLADYTGAKAPLLDRLRPQERGCMLAFVKARLATPPDLAGFRAACGAVHPPMRARLHSVLGDVDGALAAIMEMPFDGINHGNATSLYWPEMRALRADPRFWALAADLKLVKYWLETDQWPDFCRTEMDVETCRARAKEAAGIR